MKPHWVTLIIKYYIIGLIYNRRVGGQAWSQIADVRAGRDAFFGPRTFHTNG